MGWFGKDRQKQSSPSQDLPIIQYDNEQEMVHTPGRPFCADMSCPCHEDKKLILQENQYVQDGLSSPADANRRYRGRTV